MIKRLLSSALCLIVILSLFGCSSILEGETSEITPYFQTNDALSSDTSIEISTYDDFKSAVLNMVKNHTETANFRITTFDRENIDEALNEICRELSSKDPLGSYATYYISCQITPIVGYKDVTVNIVYKKEAAEIAAISTVSTDRYLHILLNSSISEYASVCTFYTSLPDITSEYIHEIISEQYYSAPLDIMIRPEITVVAYPSNEGERIIEVSFTYNNYTSSVLNNMRDNLNQEIQDIIGDLPDGDDYALISAVFEHISENTSYTSLITPLPSTAYSVIINKTGNSEGYAMAFKALCDKLLIECHIVNGKFNGEDHYWNIVTFEGNSYHIDLTSAYSDTPVFLNSDESVRENYWWDTSTVPSCESDYVPNTEATVPDIQE